MSIFSGSSEFGFEFTFSTAVNRPNHIPKVTHAHVETGGGAEHAIVELVLVPFGVLGGVPNRLTVLFFCIAAPHLVDWFLARQKVVSSLLEHVGMANFDSNLVKFALFMAISQETHLVCVRHDGFIFETNSVFTSLLLFEIEGLVDGLIVEGFRVGNS